MKKIRIGVIDDHPLMRSGIVGMISEWGSKYELVLEAENGLDLLEKMEPMEKRPHILIMDSQMPIMDGAQATAKVKDEYPETMVLALTMLDAKTNFMRLVKAGIDGFLSKSTSSAEVKNAVDKLLRIGHYFNGDQLEYMLQFLRGEKVVSDYWENLTDKEIEFIKLACSELTYKEVGDKMNISIKTVDGYRMRVFNKLKVNSRVGMVIRAVQEGIIKL